MKRTLVMNCLVVFLVLATAAIASDQEGRQGCWKDVMQHDVDVTHDGIWRFRWIIMLDTCSGAVKAVHLNYRNGERRGATVKNHQFNKADTSKAEWRCLRVESREETPNYGCYWITVLNVWTGNVYGYEVLFNKNERLEEKPSIQ